MSEALVQSSSDVLSNVLCTMPVLLCRVDRDLKYRSVNQAYLDWYGISEGDCLGHHISEVVGKAIFQHLAPYLELALKGHEQRFEREVIRKQGDLRAVSVMYEPDRTSCGIVQGVIIRIYDMTDFKERQYQYSLILENIGDGVIVQNFNEKITHFNSAALSILGVTGDQLIGTRFLGNECQIIRRRGKVPLLEDEHPVTVALRTRNKISGLELGLRLSSGVYKWIRLSVTPYFSLLQLGSDEKDPKNLKVLCHFTDITDTIAVESEKDRLFFHSPHLIAVAEPDGRFKKVNPSLSRLLGLTSEELVSRSCLDFIHPDDLPATEVALEHLRQGIPVLDFRNRFRVKSGSYVYLSWTAQIDVSDGLIYAIARDVTTERNLQSKLHYLLKALNESAIFAFCDRKGNITEANDNFCKTSGYSREELIGQNHRIVKSGAHPPEFFRKMWRTISSGSSWLGTIQNKRKNGEPYWVQTIILPVLDESGKPTQYMSIRFEITAQKKAEIEREKKEKELLETRALLIESEGYLRDVLNSISQGICGIDLDRKLTFINKIGLQLLGYENESEVLHKKVTDLFRLRASNYENEPEITVPLDGLLAANSCLSSQDHFLSRKDGSWFPVSYFARATFADHQCTGFVITFEDLTERVRLEQQVQEERSKSIQAAKLASLGELSAGVAHEINNPLAIISGATRLLERFRNDQEKFSSKLKSILDSVGRISSIVSGLKKFARLEGDSPKQAKKLTEIIREVLVLAEMKSMQSAVRIEAELSVEPVILCNEVEIEQVLLNLINNAIDAVKSQPDPWVHIGVCMDSRGVVLRIRDSGLGIPSHIENKLFTPFFTTKPIGEGTGLGLSITKVILDEHNASIKIDKTDRHTCFEIRFPTYYPEVSVSASNGK